MWVDYMYFVFIYIVLYYAVLYWTYDTYIMLYCVNIYLLGSSLHFSLRLRLLPWKIKVVKKCFVEQSHFHLDKCSVKLSLRIKPCQLYLLNISRGWWLLIPSPAATHHLPLDYGNSLRTGLPISTLVPTSQTARCCENESHVSLLLCTL